MFGARCVSKCRTPKVPKSLSPQFQHIATFDQQDIAGYDALQAIVWADYGPLDNKAFMGVAQVQVKVLVQNQPQMDHKWTSSNIFIIAFGSGFFDWTNYGLVSSISIVINC